MTGTAFTEAEEFQQIYSLDVVQIPPNRPISRVDKEDLIFKTEKAKLKAVAEAIKEHNKAGRPVGRVGFDCQERDDSELSRERRYQV
jgi:preprotein translocase subunit SecA